MSTLRLTVRSLALAALAAAGAAACSDPPPPPPKATGVQGAPIAGAPIDGTPAPAPAESSPAPATSLGDVSTADERGPEDQPVPPNPAGRHPVATEPPPAPSGAAPPPAPAPVPAPAATPAVAERSDAPKEPTPPAAPTPAAEAPPAPLGPTTAQQQPKPDLPAKSGPSEATAGDAAAPAPAPGERKSFVPKDHRKGDPIVLTWDQLASFDFNPPPPAYPDPETGVVPDQTAAIEAAKKQIPEEIWELEGQVVSIEGYMIPLEYADDGVKAFLISRHAMGCCFGVMPRPHELVECDVGEGKSVPYVGYVPVTITGVMHVGIKEGPQTVLAGIYRMDAPKLTIPKEY